jgi:hypothetical protein
MERLPMKHLPIASIAMLSACQGRPAETHAGGFVVDTFATIAQVPFERPVEGVSLPGGRLAISDAQADRVFILNADGALDTTLGTPGGGPGELAAPRHLLLHGDTLSVLNSGNVRRELFRLGEGFIATRPLPGLVEAKLAALLPNDSVLIATGGFDSALAVLQDAAGHTLARYGTPVGTASSEWDFDAMRADILAGKIPIPFRNMALPIAGPDGDVWLLQHTEGRLMRFRRSGAKVMDVVLPEADLAPVREAFFAANRAEKRPGVLRSYILSQSGAARAHKLWLLLTLPDTLPPTLLHIDAVGTVLERFRLPGAEGARYLIPTASDDTFFLTHPTEGIVFRIRRKPAG